MICLKGLIALSNLLFIQYCDSNIGLFSLASYKAHSTIATAIVVNLTLKGDSKG
jgi:hypothetical protein